MNKILIAVFTCLLLSLSFSISAQKVMTIDKEYEDGEWLCFRKTFKSGVSESGKVTIAADTKYWMYVNGNLVVREGGVKRGPNPTDTYCDSFNTLPGLRKGDNEIKIFVQYYKYSSFSHKSSGTPGLWFEMSLGRRKKLVSDDSWEVAACDNIWAPENENPSGEIRYRAAGANFGYDARISEAEYKWRKPDIYSLEEAEWGKLCDRIIPQFRWGQLSDYVSSRTEGSYIKCMLPANLQVTPYFKVKAKGGEKIDIRTDDYKIGKFSSFHTEYICKEGIQEFETPIWTNGHEVWYEIPDGVEVIGLKYRESGYDSDFAGSFECDDEFYNDLWKKAKRTLYVTMRDSYMDCPDRERAQWWGDAVNELGEATYVFDTRAHLLTRKAMYELIGWQRPDGIIHSPVPGIFEAELPCQMLASVGYYGFWTYYMATGDRQTIADLYQGVRKYIFDVWKTESNGLVYFRPGDWNWGDSGKNIDKAGLQQCWYALALKGMENMARITGHRSDELMCRMKYDKLKAAFNSQYWRGDHYGHRAYKDEPDDRVQALAVLSGMVSEDRYELMRQLFKVHRNASPYMEKYVLEALCRMGYYEDAMIRMKERFRNMVDAKYSTLWEFWEYVGTGSKSALPHGTYNHAWSGGGLTILSQFITGVEPVEPAFRTFMVSPHPAGLKHLKSVIPTPYGTIELEFNVYDNEMVMDLVVPDSTSARVVAPSRYGTVSDGTSSSSELTLSPGKYHLFFR